MSRNVKAILAGCAGAVVGGVVGFLFGGPAGAVVLGGLGALVGAVVTRVVIKDRAFRKETAEFIDTAQKSNIIENALQKELSKKTPDQERIGKLESKLSDYQDRMSVLNGHRPPVNQRLRV